MVSIAQEYEVIDSFDQYVVISMDVRNFVSFKGIEQVVVIYKHTSIFIITVLSKKLGFLLPCSK